MFLVLCGKSGSGKDTIAKRILERHSNAQMIVCLTSRPMREGETEGKEYHFVTKEDFVSRLQAGELVEHRSFWATRNGVEEEWMYGTPKFLPSEETLTVCIKDLKGAKVLKDYCESVGEPFECVMLEVPDEIRTERAQMRRSFDKTEWDRRLSADAKDFAEEFVRDAVSKVVQNDGRFTVDEIADFCYYAGMNACNVVPQMQNYGSSTLLNCKEDEILCEVEEGERE